MTVEEIRAEVVKIIAEKGYLPGELLKEENYDLPLTGFDMGISAQSLTYLFVDVVKRYNIKIQSAQIVGYQFNTINGIAKVIWDSLQRDVK